MTSPNLQTPPWCVVVADDHGPDWAPRIETNEERTPVQYSRLGGSTTLLQRALLRATRIAPASQVMVTALEEYRNFWEPALGLVRPEHRFVCENRACSPLTTAAAMLAVAQISPSHVVVVLPARCHVFEETILEAALDQAVNALPRVPQGALTLAMLDVEDGVDEDYLLVGPRGGGPGLGVLGMARRPTSWVARHLRKQGALIYSGIMVGYAGVFAAHTSKQWPGLTLKLHDIIEAATAISVESEISLQLSRGVPNPTLTSLRWHAPAFAQQAVYVHGCGWSGLRSARAVARTWDHLAAIADFGQAYGARVDNSKPSVWHFYRPPTFEHPIGPSV